MIVLYGHLSFCPRSIKVASAALALGRRRDKFIISPYKHVQCFMMIAVTARCLRKCHVETFIGAHFKRQGRVSQSTLRHSSGSYQTSSRCTVLEKIIFYTLYEDLYKIFSPSLQIIIQLSHSYGNGLSLSTCIRIIATKRRDLMVTIAHPVLN